MLIRRCHPLVIAMAEWARVLMVGVIGRVVKLVSFSLCLRLRNLQESLRAAEV